MDIWVAYGLFALFTTFVWWKAKNDYYRQGMLDAVVFDYEGRLDTDITENEDGSIDVAIQVKPYES